ncbi:MAG: hypothetical protein MJ124_01165 [Lachnospiraceae bacterium]|nr:hypothetical protein [Lachnospiraceae bacterium]
MIQTLYPLFQHWADTGSVWLLSDLHFEDADCKLMDPQWISPEEQVERINSLVKKNDTFVCLGDVGIGIYIPQIRAKRKILLTGNHDKKSDYKELFDEIYTGPVFIADRILLSHEPVPGLPWCVNIHGHCHSGKETCGGGCRHLNRAANLVDYSPVNLGELIKAGLLSGIDSIHRIAIDAAIADPVKRNDNQD